MADSTATPWGGFLRIGSAPAQNNLLVGNADGSFSLTDTLPSGVIAPGSITSADLANGAVTSKKIYAGAVISEALADGAVITTKIPDDAITTSKILDQAIISVKLKDGSVTAPKMPDGVITETKISENAISTGKIQANAITTNLLAAQCVTADTIAAGAIIAGKIAADAVTAITIKAESIETNKIKVGAVETDSIALNAVSRVSADSSNTGTVAVTLTTVPGTAICILGLFNGVLNTAATSATLKIYVDGVEQDSADIFADASASPVYQPASPIPLYAGGAAGDDYVFYNFVPWAFSGNRNLYPRSIQYNYLVPSSTTSVTVSVVSSVAADVSVLVWGLQR